MNTIELLYGWKLEAPASLSVLSNGDGAIGILYNSKQFGDIQTLLLMLSEEKVSINSFPHYIDNVEIGLDKIIRVSVSQFVTEYEAQKK